VDVRFVSVLLSCFVAFSGPLAADTVLLGDISYQPDDPITGLTDIVLDDFTDLPDLGCSSTYPACGGLDISGELDFMYTDSSGSSQTALIPVGSTGPGSTAIYEFDPTQLTFDSAILTGTISPISFLLFDGRTFDSTGSFTSDTLTPDIGFASISITGNETSAVPEPVYYSSLLILMTLGAIFLRRRSA
jgi:hypothetical protein